MEWEKQESSGFWKPENEGDELEGTIIAIQPSSFEGKNNYVLETKDGQTITTPTHGVLVSRMAKVKVGDRVRIVYTGEELPKVKGQNPMKMYDVYIGKE